MNNVIFLEPISIQKYWRFLSSVENKCTFIKWQYYTCDSKFKTKQLHKNSRSKWTKLNHYFECKNIIWSSWTQTLCNFVPQQFSSKSFFLSADWSKVCAEYFMWPIIRGLRYQLSTEPHDQFWSVIGRYNGWS